MTEQLIQGKLQHDRLGFSEYVLVDGRRVSFWIWDRLKQIPEGSYVKIEVEVMDVPHEDSGPLSETEMRSARGI